MGWSTSGGSHSQTMAVPQAGKFRITSISLNVQGAPAGLYWDDINHPTGSGSHDEPFNVPSTNDAYVTLTWGSGSNESMTIHVGTGTTSQGGSGDVTWISGHAAVIQVPLSGDIFAKNGITGTVSGPVVFNGDGLRSVIVFSNVTWDWAYGNYHFNYCDGYVDSKIDQLYGTVVSSSHTVSHKTYYHGNSGTPDLQMHDQSYVSSASRTVTTDDCAQYPNYIEINVPGQPKSFIRKGNGIVLPSLEDYLFEGWWGVANTRSGRGSEWLDGRSLGDHGDYHCYAHYMTSPIHERRGGAWHRWLPPDMNAQSVEGTKTVNNVRSKHADSTWPLDKPLYVREGGQWKPLHGPMIPPEDS